MNAYLLEEMWEDGLENDHDRAFGYNQVAVALHASVALKWINEGGVHPGSKWPTIEPGTPRRRSRQLPVIE